MKMDNVLLNLNKMGHLDFLCVKWHKTVDLTEYGTSIIEIKDIIIIIYNKQNCI